jgi:hypothetical protein
MNFIRGLTVLLVANLLWPAFAPIDPGGLPGDNAPEPFADSEVEAAFGPVLYLVGPGAGSAAWLQAGPGTLHAILYGEPERCLVSGGQELAASAAAASLPVTILDPDTGDQVYYFVDAAGAAPEQLSLEPARVIHRGETEWIAAVSAGEEMGFLEKAAASGLSISLIPPEALDPAPPLIGVAAIPSGATPNPGISAMLAGITESELRDLVTEISGERAVTVGGITRQLLTRYTFSSSIRNTEQYLIESYGRLGIAARSIPWSYSGYSGRTIVADIRGTLHPERLWIVGGHFDATSEQPGTRTPGADDNATGTAATLLLAAAIKGQRMNESVRFVHFSGEEQGQWGSRRYVSNLRAAGATVMGYINLDMIGWDGDGDRVLEAHAGTRANSLALVSRFISASERYGLGLSVELKQSTASRFSDHSPFWDYGYASFMAIENFFDGEVARDRNPWYHTTGDAASRVDFGYAVQIARAALATLMEATQVSFPASSATPTPTLSPTPTSTPTPTSSPTTSPTCSEQVSNGGMETGASWIFPTTASTGGYVSGVAHSGARSMRLGSTPSGASGAAALLPLASEVNLMGEVAAAGASYSTGYQTVSIPRDGNSMLRFWLRPGSQATSGNGDWQRVLILRPVTYTTIATVYRRLASSSEWVPVAFDLSPYRGQSVVVYFEVYNDNLTSAPRSWMYVDDVGVANCPAGTGGPGDLGTPAPPGGPLQLQWLPAVLGE